MNFEEYQEKSKKTDRGTIIRDSSIAYYTLGLADESGEVAGKVKKLYRDLDGGSNRRIQKRNCKRTWRCSLVSKPVMHQV